MSDGILTFRVSKIRGRPQRRMAIVVLYPVLTVLGWCLLVPAVLHKAARLQATLFRSAVTVWRLP